MHCLTSPAHSHCDLSQANLANKWDLFLVVPGNEEPNSIRVLFVKAYLKARITEFKHQNSQGMAHREAEKTPSLTWESI